MSRHPKNLLRPLLEEERQQLICLRTCSRSSEQQRQECQVDELQAGIEPALAVLR